MRKGICFLLTLIISLQLYGQVKIDDQKADEDKIIKIYKEQSFNLFTTRGMDFNEARSYINSGGNGIKSLKDVGNALKLLYPKSQNTGIIFYFFNNDTLKRIFFDGGVIKEQKDIYIKKEDLLKLSADINDALNVTSLSKKRSPTLRGAEVSNDGHENIPNLRNCISNATNILLPKCFNENYKHLVIIPALNIGSFPFHLLKPYKDGSYLIDKCSFTMSPSLIELIVMRFRIASQDYDYMNALSDSSSYEEYISRSKGFSFSIDSGLFVANPIYPTNTPWYFPLLPGAKNEVNNAIAYAAKYRLLQGDSATKANVIKYLRKCDIAYFATHGIASDIDPMNKSYIVLSGNREPFLTAQNIMDMRDSTHNRKVRFPEMVILSACQTGLGKSTEAGIAGLARSFLISGSNSVIMSLWNVDDEATAYLMNRFFFHLKIPTKNMPSEPLRLAILDTKMKYPDPAKWASFSLFGVDY